MENILIQDYQTSFKAFETLLKSLCLNDFPCGLGNWVKRIFVTLTIFKNNDLIIERKF